MLSIAPGPSRGKMMVPWGFLKSVGTVHVVVCASAYLHCSASTNPEVVPKRAPGDSTTSAEHLSHPACG